MSFLSGSECSSAANPLRGLAKLEPQDSELPHRDGFIYKHSQSDIRSQGLAPVETMDKFLASQQPSLPTFIPPTMALRPSPPESLSPFPLNRNGWTNEFHQPVELDQNNAKEFQNFSQTTTLPAALPATLPATPATLQANLPPDLQAAYILARERNTCLNDYDTAAIVPRGLNMAIPQAPSRQDDGAIRKWESAFETVDKLGKTVNDHGTSDAQSQEQRPNQQESQEPLENEDLENVWNSINMDQGSNNDYLNTNDYLKYREPQLGRYVFEENNSFLKMDDPFAEGMNILNEGGNLSLASLAFEAAVQRDPSRADAWTQLGAAQVQNEKEIPAIRAFEEALIINERNLDALMSLAVCYTNEGYHAKACSTLENWISIKYPDLDKMDSTQKIPLHDKVCQLFMRAAMRSPQGTSMDPEVQVGLGVLYYSIEEYDKAVDCFKAALECTNVKTGLIMTRSQEHLLWNRLGATLANSNRSEEAIFAYERALALQPNFVRAKYNLGVSCINMDCLPEAAQHLLDALSMHKVNKQGAASGNTNSTADGSIKQNESTNLYDTLRRVFSEMGRSDLGELVGPGMDLNLLNNHELGLNHSPSEYSS